MEKEKLVQFIKDNRNLFPEVTDEQIRIFEFSEDYELSLDINKKIKVTPLIMNIANYALISSLLTEDEEKDLKEHLAFEKFNIIKNAYDLSLNYLESTEGNLNHPSINLLNNFIVGSIYNEEILDICSTITEEYEEEYITNDLMDFVTEIDNALDTINSISFNIILSNVNYLDENTILDLLYRYVEQIASVSIGITNAYLFKNEKRKPIKIEYSNKLTKQIIDNEKISEESELTFGDYIQSYADIFIKINKYIDYSFDKELISLLKHLEYVYIEYKCSKNAVIKNLTDVKYLYEKCHKM